MTAGALQRLSFATGALAVVAVALGSAQPLRLDQLLSRIADRVTEFHKLAQNVVCIERSVAQPIDVSYGSDGPARTVDSELRIEAGADPSGNPAFVRQVRAINGRRPRDNDKKNRDGCTDPNPLSTEPLSFLLSGNRASYRFKSAGSGRVDRREALMIDFESIDRNSKAELIEDKGGHDDCFDWSGSMAVAGRIWIDANTYDVLRLDRRNRGPADVTVSARLQQRYHFESYIVVQREETTIRYRPTQFRDPDETLILPQSIDSVVIVSGGLQSMRQHQTFSDYRRFVTAGRVVK